MTARARSLRARPFAMAVALAGAASCVPPAAAAALEPGDDTVQFEIRVLQVDHGAAGDVVFSGQHLGGLMFVRSQAGPRPKVMIEDDDELEIDGRRWRVFDMPLEDDRRRPFRVVSSPRVLCAYDEQATISIGRPIHYLERDEEGCLQVKTDEDSFEGIWVAIRPEPPEQEGMISVRRLRVSLSSLSSRQPFEDTDLEVGKPVMSSVGLTSSFSMPPSHCAVVPVPTWDHEVDPILVVIRVVGEGP